MSLDLLKVESNERLDLLDFQYLINEFAANGLANAANLFLTNPNGSLRAWILKGFALSNPSGKQLTVTKGTAILAYRGEGAIKYGMITTAGDATKTIDMNALASNTYNVYIRFEFVDGPNSSRAFWNPEGTGSEFAQAISIKKLANWSLRVETSSPGAEWLQIGTANNSGVGLVIVDQRPLYFEGTVNSTYASGWSTDGGGGANDRNADRKTYGIADMQTFVAAAKQCLEDIKGRGLKRWWDRDIGGMNIGFDANPVSGTLAIGDANYFVSLVGGNPRITFASGDYVEYDRTANRLNFYSGTNLIASFNDTITTWASPIQLNGNSDALDVASGNIINLNDPINDGDATSKSYVDSQFSNLIINSNFHWDQRNIYTTNVTTAKQYFLDRWYAFCYGAAVPTARFTKIVTGLGPANNDMPGARLQKNAGQTNNSAIYIVQEIDRDFIQQSQNRRLRLRFMARKGANYSEASNRLYYGFTAATSPNDAWWKAYPATLGYSGGGDINQTGYVTLTNSWQSFEIIISANLSNWSSGNLRFYYTSTGTAGATDWFEVTEVSLSDQKWKLAGLTYEGELALCQKYYEVSYDSGGVGINTSVGMHESNVVNIAINNGTVLPIGFHPKFKVRKKATPTIRLWTDTGTLGSWDVSGTARATVGGVIGLNGFLLMNNEALYTPAALGRAGGHWEAAAEI